MNRVVFVKYAGDPLREKGIEKEGNGVEKPGNSDGKRLRKDELIDEDCCEWADLHTRLMMLGESGPNAIHGAG